MDAERNASMPLKKRFWPGAIQNFGGHAKRSFAEVRSQAELGHEA